MACIHDVITLIGETLQIKDQAQAFDADTPLLGHIPELDSMAVVTLITSMEEQFDIMIDDDEISADTFATVGTLAAFVDEKLT
jgi:acyl carrier protein